ncbi:transcription elongation regulator 1-like protein [Moschus berezovskii]|nr:transcription elongation regulator 1-like protein [Moschus berezovskii]
MLVGARLQRRRRQLQHQPRRRQPLLWPMNADPPPPPPPPWVWMVPGSAGLLRLGAGVAPPPVLLASAQPPAGPLLPALPAWQAPGEPLLPLLPLPSAPDHAAAAAAHRYPVLHGQWLFGGQSPSIGLLPSSSVELLPIFPHVCTSTLPLPVGKSWLDKRIPNCKIFLNNSFALDSTWIYPEESRLFHGHQKPQLLTNQVAVSLSRPAPASRPLPTVVIAPQPLPGGCHSSLKPMGSSPTVAIAAAATAVVSVDPEGLGGPSPSRVQPCHLLTLAPIRMPLRTTPFPDKKRQHASPLLGASPRVAACGGLGRLAGCGAQYTPAPDVPTGASAQAGDDPAHSLPGGLRDLPGGASLDHTVPGANFLWACSLGSALSRDLGSSSLGWHSMEPASIPALTFPLRWETRVQPGNLPWKTRSREFSLRLLLAGSELGNPQGSQGGSLEGRGGWRDVLPLPACSPRPRQGLQLLLRCHLGGSKAGLRPGSQGPWLFWRRRSEGELLWWGLQMLLSTAASSGVPLAEAWRRRLSEVTRTQTSLQPPSAHPGPQLPALFLSHRRSILLLGAPGVELWGLQSRRGPTWRRGASSHGRQYGPGGCAVGIDEAYVNSGTWSHTQHNTAEPGHPSLPGPSLLGGFPPLETGLGGPEPPAILVTSEDSTPKGSKPVASTPVPGSPWCVVWTGDDRVFFFNPTMQLSVWEKPMDLRNRGDLNRIIEDPPHKRKLEAAATEPSDGSSSEDGREDPDVKTKRNRTEGHMSPGPAEAERQEVDAKTALPQILLPLEERAAHFRDMLLERGVSAFSTWEKELHKIVFDPRYLLLNSEERKQIFEQFVKTRIKEEYKEKKSKLLLAKEEFKKLLEESKLSPRTTFKEFAEKYGRDQRFRLVQKRKDQEHFFNQFILILKKRDKENRLRLRKMR